MGFNRWCLDGNFLRSVRKHKNQSKSTCPIILYVTHCFESFLIQGRDPKISCHKAVVLGEREIFTILAMENVA